MNISDLPNFGQKSQAMLAQAGIHTIEQLRELGAVSAFVQVKHCGSCASLNLLWAIEGALSGRHWREVAKHDRLRLLLELEEAERLTIMHPILRMLQGGDRRSIGRSNEVVARVLKEPELFAVLFSGFVAADPLLRMRCADAAEKVSAQHPEYLQLYKQQLLGKLAGIEQKEVRWHIAAMLPRLELTKSERERAVKILLGYTNGHGNCANPDNETCHARFPHPNPLPQAGEGANESLREFHANDGSGIVKTLAMQALADLASCDEKLRSAVQRHIRELTIIGTPAMKARGRKLLAQLDKSP